MSTRGVSHRGRLLVATPSIESGPFRRSVVYLLDHDDDGALGVIVNRPLDADVDDVLPDWADVVAAPVCLFHGGPVQVDSALAVGLLGGEVDQPDRVGWQPMCGHVGLVDLDGPVPSLGELAGLRVFAGYAGWGPGQLEAELEEASWLVVDARDEDLVSPRPDELWHDVMRRQHGDLRYWSTFPSDPNTN